MFTSPNMSLIIWDQPDDAYDHNELAGNFRALDDHDHTGGHGVQIPTSGLKQGAVDGNVLAPNTVTTNHIVDHTIQRIDLADGIIGADQIDPSIFNGIAPLGIVCAWFRPNTGVAVPPGWALCTGQTLNSTQHGWGNFNVQVPDLQGKFVLGAATTGTGTTPDLPPAENAVGGAHSRFWNHSHSIPDHSHTVSSHTHSITAGGAHNHSIHSRMNAFDGYYEFRDTLSNIHAANKQSLYIAGFNGGPSDPADALAPNSGSHDHGGATGSATAGTSSTSLSTDSQSPGGDIRPAYYGLLYIIKVKHNA
jgi:hypothetical protein